MNYTITNELESDLVFGTNLYQEIDDKINTYYKDCKKVILTDSNLHELWVLSLITNVESLKNAEIIEIEPGEINKSIETCVNIWDFLNEIEFNRNDLIINFGGGVITDMGGFIASTFKRGVNFINIPTTLLAQVDASVGGKTGIDILPYKNTIGTFSVPKFVFIDSIYLKTLHKDEFNSGYAEMLKHGIIENENHFKDLLKSTKDKIGKKVKDSVKIKIDIVKDDLFEANNRKKLNFGHTIGHAIEGYFISKNKEIKHGYAIAWGMIAETFISKEKGFISNDDYVWVKNELLKKFGLPKLKEEEIPSLLLLMKNDKKNNDDRINFTLLKSIGEAIINQYTEEELIVVSIKELIK